MSDTAAPQRSLRASLEDWLDRDWALALSLAFFVAVVVWLYSSRSWAVVFRCCAVSNARSGRSFMRMGSVS